MKTRGLIRLTGPFCAAIVLGCDGRPPTSDAASEVVGDTGASVSTTDGGKDADMLADRRDLPADDAELDATDDGQSVEVPSRGCDPLQRFGTPTRVAGLPSDDRVSVEARFSPDELTAYFTRPRPEDPCCNYDIYVAKRTSLSEPFGPGAVLTSVNSTAADNAPTVTGDDLVLFFHSSRDSANYHIYMATRTSPAEPFSAPIFVPELNSTSLDAAPYVLPAGHVLYFTSFRSGAGDIYRAERTDTTFGAPVAVTALNTALLENSPVVTPDERTLYFSSKRTGAGAVGGFDIWVATRASTAEPYASPVSVGELNTPVDELPSWVSPDGCRVYFVREEANGRHVYVAEKPPSGT